MWSAGLCGPSTVTQRFWDRTGHNLWTPRPEEQRCLLGCGCVRQLAHSVGMEKDHRTECFLYPYVLILGLNKKELHIRLERSGRILGVADNSVNSSLTLIHGFCISFPALSSPLIWKAIECIPKGRVTIHQECCRRAAPQLVTDISWYLYSIWML